jgi:hypothetical protein
VLKRKQAVGEYVYCPSCTGEYITEEKFGQLQPVSTGRLGSSKSLVPQADILLIKDFVRNTELAELPA